MINKYKDLTINLTSKYGANAIIKTKVRITKGIAAGAIIGMNGLDVASSHIALPIPR